MIFRVMIMVFNATFNNIQLYCGVSFIGGGNQTTTGLSQVTDRLDHIKLHRVHLAISRIKLRRGRCGLDHMVVGFTTTYATCAYHH